MLCICVENVSLGEGIPFLTDHELWRVVSRVDLMPFLTVVQNGKRVER